MLNKIKKIKYLPNYLKNKIRGSKMMEVVGGHFKNRKQIEFYRKYIGENKLVFDIGANTGNKVDLFLKLGCKVIAFEPQSNYAGFLKVKYLTDKNVSVEQLALGEKDGEATINISDKYPGFSSLISNWQEGTKYHSFNKTEKILVTTMDKMVEKYGLPDFCKIDVEGYEYFVLLGLSKKIPLLNFEFHSDSIKETSKCIDRLVKIGYKEFNFIESENTKMSLSEWVNAEQILKNIELISIKKGRVIWGDIYAK